MGQLWEDESVHVHWGPPADGDVPAHPTQVEGLGRSVVPADLDWSGAGRVRSGDRGPAGEEAPLLGHVGP